MNTYNVPVAKRTRSQKQLLDQGFRGTSLGFSGTASKISRKRNKETSFTDPEIIDDDDDDVDDHEDDDGEGGGGGTDDLIKNRASEAADTQYEPDDKIKVYGSSSYFSSVAKRTRFQRQLLDQGFCGSASKKSQKRNRDTGFTLCGVNPDHVVIVVDDEDDDDDNDGGEAEPNDKIKGYGLASPFKSGKHSYSVFLDDSDEDDSVSIIEEEDEACKLQHGSENNAKTSSFQSSEDESFSSSESEKLVIDHLRSLINETPNPTDESSDKYVHEKTVDDPKEKQSHMEDNLDSDDEFVILKEEEVDVDLHIPFKYDHGSQNDRKESSLQSTEDEPHSSSESENDDSDDSDFLQAKKRPHQYTKNNKTNMKESVRKPIDESNETNVHEKQNAKGRLNDRYMKIDKANPVKYNKSKKCVQRDYGGRIDDILDSIIKDEDVHGEKEDDRLPLKFKFDDTEDESSQKTDESNGEDLFEEMEFVFQCDEIGSYKIPKEEKRETDDYYDDIDPCERGVHGDIILEEQIGLRCSSCGAVLLESRFVIEKLATYAPNRSRRNHHFDKQQEFCSFENPYFMDPESNHYDICHETEGTVWELVTSKRRSRMYPHQQEGFEFLWKNLAETIDLSRLQTLGPRGDGGGGGGCIISHAPGTGKTFLTIVFIESFIKKFPKCCPVIVAPASMLLTWEAEFKKWQADISFINLQNTEPLREEKIIRSSKHNKDYIRALKIKSWINGKGVLGVSYNLFEKLTRTSYEKNTDCESSRMYLLDKPGLVVLDEGHKARNKNSQIWNTLLKLETKNRVILSGTPFQNNFRELFNTLRIVRPATAKGIENKRLFADLIQRENKKKSRGRPNFEEIEKLKETISPFVHVHEGHILKSELPGLKQSVILLNPSAFQNSLIENLGVQTSTFKYERKVAMVSVHPSLILHYSLSEKEENMINKQELEKKRLQPEVGVKTRFVMELIRLSLSLNEKVLIFSQYIPPSKLLQDQIALTFGWDVEQEVSLINGRISQSRRQHIINVFNDPKSELKVLLASTKCCFEGIHLYGASRVVLLDIVWNPSAERQAICRAYRLGQKKVVYTYHLVAAGTTEEDKYDRQVEKGRLAEMVFSSASMASGEPKSKVNVDDKILQEMVENQQLKSIFKKIRHPENQTRI